MKIDTTRQLQSAFWGLALIVSTLGFSSFAQAETVAIPLGKQGDYWNVERPKTGLSKADVETRFGSPVSRSGPVGDPPIYTWDYPDFKVFFESDYVIHSVVKHQPKDSE